MHLRSFLLLSLLLLLNLYSTAQKYFQQKVDHKIHVSLDDHSHILRAHTSIHYTNNSPDTLDYIYFHLWPNAYSSDRTAFSQQEVENRKKDFYLADKNDWGFIDSLHFSVDGLDAGLEKTQDRDIAILRLNQPLLPGESIQIETPFKVQIPKSFSRLGQNEGGYMISQWFPKPAVYDHKGWHPMPYLSQGEFYSEFGSYDVSITLPKNYVVMATGNLQTASETEWLNTLAQKPIEDYPKAKEIPSAKETKTIRYTEDQVHDFAWFADKRWVVRHEKIQIDHTQQEVDIYTTFFPELEKGWKNSVEFVAQTIQFYSKEVGTYPYKTVKAVAGSLIAGGGMEYPTVTIIMPYNNPQTVFKVIAHEVGHNWFYGILANNERIHPWLDESGNSFYEKKMSNLEFNIDIAESAQDAIANHQRKTFQAQPVSSPSTDFQSLNYGLDVYDMGPKYIAWLEAYLGEEVFQSAMHDYFNKYKFRHVYPEDFQSSFEQSTGQDLSWFFDEVLNTQYPIDFSIESIQQNGDQVEVMVKNHSPIKVPAIIYLIGEDHKYFTLKTEPFTGKKSISFQHKGTAIKSGNIDISVPDNNTKNNYFYKNKNKHWGIAPVTNFNMLGENNKEIIALSPAFGYNYYDGFMLGLLAHNVSIPYPNFNFAIAPLYGFHSKNIVGTGFLSYTQYLPENKSLHHIQYKLEGKSFDYENSHLNITNNVAARYIKIAPEVKFVFKKSYPRSPLKRDLSVKAYYIQEQGINFEMDPTDSLFRPSEGDYTNHFYGRVRYTMENDRTFNPYSLVMDAQAGRHFTKISATAKLKIDYHLYDKALYTRAFIGKFIGLGTDALMSKRYALSAAYSGWNDYLYDHSYFARHDNNTFLSKQIAMQEGGLKINTLMYANQLGLSEDWMFALNIKSDIPIKTRLPIQIFGDFASFSGARLSNPSKAKFLWDAGIQIGYEDEFTIYIPILYSKDYKDYLRSIYGKNAFWSGIGFSVNLNKIDWSRPVESSKVLNLVN